MISRQKNEWMNECCPATVQMFSVMLRCDATTVCVSCRNKSKVETARCFLSEIAIEINQVILAISKNPKNDKEIVNFLVIMSLDAEEHGKEARNHRSQMRKLCNNNKTPVEIFYDVFVSKVCFCWIIENGRHKDITENNGYCKCPSGEVSCQLLRSIFLKEYSTCHTLGTITVPKFLGENV